MITPTARSTTLPFIANSLNSLVKLMRLSCVVDAVRGRDRSGRGQYCRAAAPLSMRG